MTHCDLWQRRLWQRRLFQRHNVLAKTSLGKTLRSGFTSAPTYSNFHNFLNDGLILTNKVPSSFLPGPVTAFIFSDVTVWQEADEMEIKSFSVEICRTTNNTNLAKVKECIRNRNQANSVFLTKVQWEPCPALYSSPLCEAVKGFNLDVVKYLVEELGADVNGDSHFAVPLIKAAQVGAFEIADYLLEKGADPNVKDRFDYCPLMVALIHYSKKVPNCDAIVKLLLNEENIKINIFSACGDIEDGEESIEDCHLCLSSPLHICCFNMFQGEKNTEITKILMALGADVNDQCQRGYTPLHVLCKQCTDMPDHYELGTEVWNMIEVLLTAGADVNLRIDTGETPLMFVCNWDSNPRKAIEMLLLAGARVDFRDCLGRSALMNIAYSSRDVNNVNLLLEHGANIYEIPNDEASFLHKAGFALNIAGVKKALERGLALDIDAKPSQQLIYTLIFRQDPNSYRGPTTFRQNPDLYTGQDPHQIFHLHQMRLGILKELVQSNALVTERSGNLFWKRTMITLWNYLFCRFVRSLVKPTMDTVLILHSAGFYFDIGQLDLHHTQCHMDESILEVRRTSR